MRTTEQTTRARRGPVDGSARLPLAGPAILDRLRVTGRARPVPDPGLVADLRAHLESAVAGPAGEPAADGPPAVPQAVTSGRITRALACAGHAVSEPADGCGPSLALACGALVDVLFRQLVTTGSIGDPFAEGLDALGVDERGASLVGWIGALAPGERSELRSEVERQAEGLRARWPALDPAWLPRTKESMRVPLCGGRVELLARVDLVIGRPSRTEASVALVDVTSGARRSARAADRGFQALVETLRSGTPPFVVATYYARTGELDVDPVSSELLVAAARRCRAGLRALSVDPVHPGAEVRPGPGDLGPTWCSSCADGPPSAPVAGPFASPQVLPATVTCAATGPVRLPGARAADGDPSGAPADAVLDFATGQAA